MPIDGDLGPFLWEYGVRFFAAAIRMLSKNLLKRNGISDQRRYNLEELEKRILEELSVDRVWKDLAFISSIGERLAGSPSERKLVNYIKKDLDSSKIPNEKHEFIGYVSRMKKGELKVIHPAEEEITCEAWAYITSTQAEGIEGEILYLGDGDYEDYKGVDAKDKIVLVANSYKPIYPLKIKIAETFGAAGLILMAVGKPENPAIPQGTARILWGVPDPEYIEEVISPIPAVSITNADGRHLVDLSKRGKVKVLMKAEATSPEWMLETQISTNVRGAKEPEKYLLVAGHLCANGMPGKGGATDNGCGDAVLLELARVFNKFRGNLRRSIKFAWWTGHTNEIYEGSAWFCDNHWDDLKTNAVAYYDMDMIGLKGTKAWCSSATEEIKGFIDRNIESYLGEKVLSDSMMKAADMSFLGVGLPSMFGSTRFPPEQIEEMGVFTGWWYHSIHDTIDKADPKQIERAMKMYAVQILRLVNSVILPFEFVTVADAFIGTFGALESKASGLFDFKPLLKKAKSVRAAAEKLDFAIRKIQSRYEGLNEEERRELEPLVDMINEYLMRLSRALMPALYNESGKYKFDPVGSIAVKLVPALQPAVDLPELDPKSGAFIALRTKLTRNRNMISDSLDQAVDIMGQLLAKLSRVEGET